MGENIEVYIHIGSPKTGTSAIQAFFNANREQLAKKHACLYPNFNDPSFDTGTQHNHCLFFRKTSPESIPEYLNKLILTCRKKNIRTLVLSCEFLFHRLEYAAMLSRAFREFPDVHCRIIVYLRREDHFLESSWKQWGVKKHRDIYHYIGNQNLDWDKKLDCWADEFGTENIIARVYEKEQLPNGLIADFFATIRVDFSSDTWIEPKKNALNANFGFSQDILEILHLNPDMFTDGNDHRLLDFFDRNLPDSCKKAPFEKYDLLSPADRLEILERYSAMNDYIARRYLGRSDGTLFSESAPHPGDPWVPYEGLTLEKIIPVFMQVLYHIDRNKNPRSNPYRRELNREKPVPFVQYLKNQVRKLSLRKNSERKTIFLHIGPPKTGTSAIQLFLSTNRKALERHGYLYPGNSMAHHEMAQEFRKMNIDEIENDYSSATRQYFSEIHSSSAKNVILSSENFEGLMPHANLKREIAALREFLVPAFNVRIIYYVRRQDEKIESMYNESLRNQRGGSGKTFLEFIQKTTATCRSEPESRDPVFNALDYYLHLSAWAETFGKENIIVRCHEKEQLPRGIYQDFLNAVGLELDETFTPPGHRVHESLRWDLAEILRICNFHYPDDLEFHRFLLKNFKEINAERAVKKQYLQSPQERRDFLEYFNDSNTKVAREFLGRNDGRLFFAPLPDPHEPWKPSEGLTLRIVVTVFIRMLSFTERKSLNKSRIRNFRDVWLAGNDLARAAGSKVLAGIRQVSR